MLNQEKLLLHMAWANQFVLAKLEELSEADWQLKLTEDDWSIQELTNHIVLAAGGYAQRISGEWVYENLNQEMVIPLADLQKYCSKADEILRVQSHKPDSIDIYMRQGLPIERSRSTIISQSIHHATEHRAQISDTLKVHGIRILDLDEIDLWAFSDIAGEINSPNG
ncbi:MAG: DinB family protein [Actinomycetes bacterium]